MGHDVTCAAFATATLGGHPQFELDIVKTQTGLRITRDFTVRNSVAYTNNHDRPPKKFNAVKVQLGFIINANRSHL